MLKESILRNLKLNSGQYFFFFFFFFKRVVRLDLKFQSATCSRVHQKLSGSDDHGPRHSWGERTSEPPGREKKKTSIIRKREQKEAIYIYMYNYNRNGRKEVKARQKSAVGKKRGAEEGELRLNSGISNPPPSDVYRKRDDDGKNKMVRDAARQRCLWSKFSSWQLRAL